MVKLLWNIKLYKNYELIYNAAIAYTKLCHKKVK